MPYNSLVARTDAAALVPAEVANNMLANLGNVGSAALALGTRIPVATNQTRFPVLSALPAAYWVTGDTGVKETTQAAWANKYLNIEELATIVPIPENVLDDAGFDVWGAIQPLMENAIARAFDAAVFFGTSAPATFVTEGAIVTRAVAAGNVVARGTNAAAAGGLHGDISDLLGTLEADGYTPTGAVGNITLRGRLRQVRATTGEQMALAPDVPEVNYSAMQGMWPTGVNAAEAIVGDFRNLIIGVRRDMSYKLITEGVITNGSGVIQYNLPQQDMVAMRLVFRAGYAVSNPLNYQQATEASRYPFAILRSPAA